MDIGREMCNKVLSTVRIMSVPVIYSIPLCNCRKDCNRKKVENFANNSDGVELIVQFLRESGFARRNEFRRIFARCWFSKMNWQSQENKMVRIQ